MAIDDIYDAVLAYDDAGAAKLVQAEIDAGVAIATILDDGLIAAMDEVGAQFSEGILFVPEMLVAARAMKAGMEVLRPLLAEADIKSAGTVIVGTVQNDLHDIGKSLVGMMLEGAGFAIVDLGVDVPPDVFVAAAEEHQADIIAMSALLTTTMPAMQATVGRLKDDMARRNFGTRVIVGGAPVNRAFADAIGADGFADDAPGAVELARQLVAGDAS
jgi:5-methyltetrahydrofolate--homocysteine methyltransferase